LINLTGTPILIAAQKGYVDVAKYLIKHGAKIDYNNHEIKALFQDEEIITLFLDKLEKAIDDCSLTEPKSSKRMQRNTCIYPLHLKMRVLTPVLRRILNVFQSKNLTIQ
jgi:hypothetical protein